MKNIYAPVLIVTWILIATPITAIAAEATCTVDEVRRFDDRVHVRCLERYWNPITENYSIRYFAAPTSSRGRSDRLEDHGNQTNIKRTNTTTRLKIYYDPNSRRGASFGCRTNDCREVITSSMWPRGRRESINVGDIEGETRSAIVYPTVLTERSAVVLYFHGGGGSAEGSAGVVPIHNLWPEATVVYAQGSKVDHAGRPSGRSGWELRFPHKYAMGQRKDLVYVRRLINEVTNKYPAMTNRIYAVGHSRGGFFTFSLSELMPNTFAAFAVVGAYSRFGVSLVGLECYALDSNQAAKPRKLLGNFGDEADDPRPFLYVFGKSDTAFNNDTYSKGRAPGVSCSNRSDLVRRRGYAASSTVKSWARHTLDELIFRNSAKIMNHNGYWQTSGTFLTDGHVAPVEFKLHPGGHSWPVEATQWVVDFLRRFSR